MNNFKHGDMIRIRHLPELGPVMVKYIDGPYVYYKNPKYDGANVGYQCCTLVRHEPKFKPGDIVSNGETIARIKCVKTHYNDGSPYNGKFAYDYVTGGFDYEEGLTLVSPDNSAVVAFMKSGQLINAIKEYRSIYGVGLKEAKDAVEAMRDKSATKYRVGDIVATKDEPNDHGRIVRIGDNGKYAVKFDSYGGMKESHIGCLWTDNDLNLVNAKSIDSTSCIVVRNDSKVGYRPNDKPRVHSSLAEATAEAKRLAIANPGVGFAVFALANTTTATAPTVTTVAA